MNYYLYEIDRALNSSISFINLPILAPRQISEEYTEPRPQTSQSAMRKYSNVLFVFL